MKDSIIFYLSHYEVVKQLDNEQLGKLYRALFELALENEPKVDEDIKIPFGFIKNQMVLDIEKYNEKRMKNKENGKLGGRPKKNATEEIKKPKKANGFFENPNDNDNDNDNDINNNSSSNSIYDFVEKNLGRTLSPLEYEEIKNWEDNDLTRYAIKKSFLNGKYTLAYVKGILNYYKKNNIATVQEAMQAETNFKKRKVETKQIEKKERKDNFIEVLKEIEDGTIVLK